jgi:hypothetical protein
MVVGGGALALISSFFAFVGVTLRIAFVSYSSTIDAWHSYSTIGVLLVLAAAIIWTLYLLGAATLPAVKIGWGALTTGAAAVGTLLIIVRAFSYPTGVTVHFGGYLLIAASLAVTAGAAWAFMLDAAGGRAGAAPGTTVKGGSPFGAPPPEAAGLIPRLKGRPPRRGSAPTGAPPSAGPPQGSPFPMTAPAPGSRPPFAPPFPGPGGPGHAPTGSGPGPTGSGPAGAPGGSAGGPAGGPGASDVPPFPTGPMPGGERPGSERPGGAGTWAAGAPTAVPGMEPTGQPTPPGGASPAAGAQPSLGERLAEADRLRGEGVISDAEYRALRARILGSA